MESNLKVNTKSIWNRKTLAHNEYHIYIIDLYHRLIQVKKFPKVSLLCRKIICSNSESIQVQVYSLNLYYMNKFQSL